MIREFHLQFPGICGNAAQAVAADLAPSCHPEAVATRETRERGYGGVVAPYLSARLTRRAETSRARREQHRTTIGTTTLTPRGRVKLCTRTRSIIRTNERTNERKRRRCPAPRPAPPPHGPAPLPTQTHPAFSLSPKRRRGTSHRVIDGHSFIFTRTNERLPSRRPHTSRGGCDSRQSTIASSSFSEVVVRCPRSSRQRGRTDGARERVRRRTDGAGLAARRRREAETRAICRTRRARGRTRRLSHIDSARTRSSERDSVRARVDGRRKDRTTTLGPGRASTES